MTSKGEAQETSEFLRRRQLRLQQVREQSKDVAKKLRQRAKVEKLRQVVELDEKKERDYKQSQAQFVTKLEELYSKGFDNVGSSHKQARGLTQPVNPLETTDLSHLRGREAAAEVKRQKQQKLDELKKSLDRKVHAREAANVLSREKSASAANKLFTKSSSKKNVNQATKPTSDNVTGDQDLNDKDSPEEISRIDMGTQWDIDLLPPEWEPNIPALAIPPEDDTKQSVAGRDHSADKQTKTNLFALSDEMPSSLRGSIAKPPDTAPSKPSSTLVSEYIQNRVLRLREPEVTPRKQHTEDLKNLRQTIIRSRPLRPGGSAFSNICHVVEGQEFPVPTWHPETGCQCQSPSQTHHCKQYPERKQFPNVTLSNKIYNSVCPVKHNVVSSPVSEETRPFILHKLCGHNKLSGHGSKDGSLRGKGSDNLLTKKKSITMYNHSTKDSRDVPRADERLVRRERSAEDAYSRALSEAASATSHDRHKSIQHAVNRVAVTRQNVEREYKDTMAFLNCLPKNKNTRPINNAFKDDHRLQAQKENRQRILQQEFKNIEEESRRQESQSYKIKSRFPDKQSKSPPDLNADTLNERDFRYSWMPVPESDSRLAVHTIPTGARPSVQFRADSYHEYRSRHKHTPPTRDRPPARARDTSASADDDSSTDSRDSAPQKENDVDDSPQRELTETERIIIYKMLNYKHRKKDKTGKISSTDDVTQSNEGSKETDYENVTKASSYGAVSKDVEHNEHVAVNSNDPLSTDNITEGVYGVASKQFSCNILNCFSANVDPWQSIFHHRQWWGNLESMVSAELDKNQSSRHDNKCDKRTKGPCSVRADAGDGLQPRKKCSSAKCKGHSSKGPSVSEASPSNTEKAGAGVGALASAAAPAGGPGGASAAALAGDPRGAGGAQPAAFLKLIDEGEQRAGNFYIGATGFLKHDAYEVIIQLRKNDTLKETAKKDDGATEQKTSDARNETTANTKIEASQCLEAKEDVVQKISDDNHPVAIAPPNSSTDLVSVISTDVPAATLTEDNKEQCISSTTSDDVQPTKTMHDRSVSTSFKDTYPLTEPSSKSDPIPRPATSICTQTTPSPPHPRPVYIHMSSSTSTAYMSPPEVVLPNFFRRGDKPCRKPRRPSRQERQFIREEHHCKRYSSCKVLEKITEPKVERLNFHAERQRERKESTLSSPVSHVRNYRCSRCSTRGGFDLSCKQHSQKIQHYPNTDKPDMSAWNTKSVIMHSKRHKRNTHSGKLSSKSYLSPMIREYIHKLLSLNQEGIKAIQIINQDCSSVNTPASSIINVPTNLSIKSNRHRSLDIHDHEVSLEQLKRVLKEYIFLSNDATHLKCGRPENTTKSHNMVTKNIKSRKRNSKNKRLHKVKSLNISKKIVVKPSELSINRKAGDNSCSRKHLASNVGSQGSLLSEHINKSYGESGDKGNVLKTFTTSKELHRRNVNQLLVNQVGDDSSSGQTKAATSSENNFLISNDEIPSQAINTSTQTSRTPDGEINFIKLAEDKLQNMEKIADLTEKCTKRLSNLAKVLEEVRKNKSLAYSQVSTADSTSDSDQKSDKGATAESANLKMPLTASVKSSQIECNVDSTDYEYLVPGVSNTDDIQFPEIDPSENILSENSNTECISKSVTSVSTNDDCRVTSTARCRNKPPPALLRIHLKRPQDNVVPHELSTVIEVDSPSSVKFKQQSSSVNANQSVSNFADSKKDKTCYEEHQFNPELVQSVVDKSSKHKIKFTSSDSSEDSKLQMMDLNQFNEIMLRPFVSLQEYARDLYYGGNLNTNGENVSKDIGLTEDISSLHSDSSLPDVVAELLKRKLITEPFRFDTASNVNSTTISSESTLSVLALSKIQRDKGRSKLSANKENVGETSDSLSISSNPDLENAFKKLGLGWASSTLKKTKERLALSSSSNTSSSSLSQLKFKNSKPDEPVADSGWAVSSLSKKSVLKRGLDASKNVEQQTSFSNNMTVKEFLTKELAKKITFTDKSNRNDTNQDFVSLIETKLPEGLKNSSQTMLDDNSGDSAPSVNNNRARTSTPVKLFKSMTYHSSSSSNISNGLFSNADDLSSVKLTSASIRNQSASEKDELTIPNCSLKMRKTLSDCSKTDSY